MNLTTLNTFLEEFTSTGSKIPWHRDVVDGLRAGRGVPKVAGIFVTDICQHSCAFCSTANRARDVLPMEKIVRFVEQLHPLGLKAVILSGGGNPILYRDGKNDFNSLVEYLYGIGLQIGCITNGMPMKTYEYSNGSGSGERVSWKNVHPRTLDMLTWVRISLSGWDHGEEIEVPDIDPHKTALGGSWVYHDRYLEPGDRHGKVSRPEDLKTPLQPGDESTRVVWGKDQLPIIKEKMRTLVEKHPFQYVRLLPNCYEVEKIQGRCEELRQMAKEVDERLFVQYKPPSPHSVCLLGYSHPVLWPDGGVTPCDSVTLNPQANRSAGGDVYKIAQWDTIGELYANPVRSLIDPMKHCAGCVFGSQNRLLDRIWKGENVQPAGEIPLHVNFV